MSSDEIDAMLDNLKVAKGEKEAAVEPQSHPDTKERLQSDDALEVLMGEVDRLFDEHESVTDNLNRNEVHCAVARWDGKNGYCKYNTMLDGKQRFNKRLTSTSRKSGHHLIGVNEKILEQGNRDDFLDTTRHELAHAVVYEIHNQSQGHNHNWKAMASKLGADPSSCHSKRDRSNEFEYYIVCPNEDCDMEGGKTKRSKVIKQPFNRKCGKCGESSLSSYEDGQEPPTENGVVKVESLAWNNEEEWRQMGRP
jgi:predicted SprT family Zn-dependent metalloprotease